MSTTNRATGIGLLVTLVVSGCTTLEPVVGGERLHERISTGNVIEVGDSIKIVTAGGAIHKFKVSAITADRITGRDIELPIDDIVFVERREFSRGKTIALATVGVVPAMAVAAVDAAASLQP